MIKILAFLICFSFVNLSFANDKVNETLEKKIKPNIDKEIPSSLCDSSKINWKIKNYLK